LDAGQGTLVVAKDARTHSPLLAEYLIRGIISTGCKALNIGTVPTPLLYFATETLGYTQSGVVVTASHNPANYNGFKLVLNGKARMEDDIQAVRRRIEARDFRMGLGQEEHLDIMPAYIDAIYSDVALAGDVSIVLDAGNGVTGKVAPRLFEELGCQVTSLYCDLDGTFPNHGPDPTVEANLADLIAKVKEENADLGVAFDGDGDRLVVVTSTGQIIWPDRLLMLFAKDILARNPGADVVFDVKSSRLLTSVVASQGGRPIMWKTGHSPMKAKVQETGALLGGEYSGHIFIKDRWYGFDDGMYAAARLIEIMSLREQSLDDIFAEFLPLPSTSEYRVKVAEEEKISIVQRLIEEGDFGDAKLITLDGVRVEYPYGWGIVRPSNTESCLTLRFEAETEANIHKLKALFTRELRKIDNRISFAW
ncbi:MAG TPA: phosphomannomutase/phosphoglucomutase, partial [Cellvibrionaceae bacterium]|nr:phosphomannomutase/phosphoglucomutase [Cellvibrionaceae bacterium]